MEEKKSNFEKRSLKRRHLVFYLEVYETETDTIIGNLADITTQGLLILSPTPELPKNELNIKIKIPKTKRYSKEFIELTIESKWSQIDINPKYFSIGCQIITSGPQDNLLINELIRDFGFSD